MNKPAAPRRRIPALSLSLALAALLAVLVGAAPVAHASEWSASNNSKARLVSGSIELEGKPTVLAAVQLRLDDGWKTYWRNPGDSGVPPRFNWSGSKNLKTAEVLYPAPHRFADGSGTSIGYEDEVVFPVRIVPEREGEAVELDLSFDYGVCKDLCVPNEVRLGLELPAGAAEHEGDALLIESALARVPKPAVPGRLPSLGGVDAKLAAPRPELVIDAVFPAAASATDLFLEAGDSYIPVPKPAGPAENGKQRFVVDFVSETEAMAIKNQPLTLTLVSDLGSTETALTLE